MSFKVIPVREKIFAITEPAREMVLRVRADQPDAERLALRVEITGASQGEYDSSASFQLLDEVGSHDVVERHDGLVLVCPADDVEQLSGTTIDLEGDQITGSLIIVHQKQPLASSPSPAVAAAAGPTPDLTGDVAQRIKRVLDEQINPGIASHGGHAELVAVEDSTAYVRLSGGCQGCSMAPVTLSQGIEVAMTAAAPEITRVVDVTEHANGTNPYYEEAKK
jgi:Fe/S biogenesis protein NfuA